MSEWKEYKIGDIIVLEYGKALKDYQDNLGEFNVYGTNGLIGKTGKYLYDQPSLIIGRKGAYREVHYTSSPFFVIDTAFYTKNKFKNLNTKFLYYWFKNIDINLMDSGSAIPSTSRDEAYDLDIRLPDEVEQQSIACILSSLDDKIDLLQQQNQTLEKMAETLFRQWFVEEAKEDWEELELGSVVETTSGGTPSRANMKFYEDGTFYWVKSKELNGSFILATEEKITTEALKKSSAKMLPAYSILIAMYGATVGEYSIISEEMTCNQAICALKPNENYPYTFLFLLVKASKDELINMAVGSAQQNISQALIKKIPVPNCPEKIKKFHSIVNPIFEKIKSNSIQIRSLTALRDTLLPKLMSGEVRVNFETN